MEEELKESKEYTQEELEALLKSQEEFYDRQIPLAKKRAELAELNAKAVEAEVRRLEASIKLAYIKNPLNASTEDNKEVPNKQV